MRWLQPALLLLCLFELVFFAYYMLRFEIQTQSTISDTLFSTPEYAITLSLTLTIRLMGGALYLYRFRYEYPKWEIIGYFGLVCALSGW